MKNCINCKKELGERAEYYKTQRCRSCSAKERLKISENNPNFKLGETLKKYYCIDCKKEITYVTYKFGTNHCQSCWQLGNKNNQYKLEELKKKFYCITCGEEISKNYTAKYCKKCWAKILHKKNCNCCSCRAHRKEYVGKNHPNYINGEGNFPYPLKFNDQLKESIRQRDNYICQNCNTTEEEHLIVYGRVLHVHHIDYNKQNCKEDNLITICNQCNVRANYNRNYWIEYYKNKIIILTENGGITKNGKI